MKGDGKLIRKLDDLLKEELTAINQYMVHSEMCANWGYQRLHERIEKRAIQEMKHAEKLIARILFLEGTPTVSQLDAIHIGADVPKQLQADLDAELLAIRTYNEGIRLAGEVGDAVTRDLLEDIIKDEDEHVDWLEAQLDQINQMGVGTLPVDSDLRVRMKILVLGLGNPLVTDDSVGLRVVAELRSRLADRPEIEVGEDFWGGLRLMERMAGFDRAIVVDAIRTGAPPGTIHPLTCDSIPTQRSASTHDVNLPTALELGRTAGLHLPLNEDILLVGIEAEDILSFGEKCTPAVEAAILPAVEVVLSLLKQFGDVR